MPPNGSPGEVPPAPVYYSDYLRLDKLLSAQEPMSDKLGKKAHDEMLFIIVHQVHELWFKQILHELDAVVDNFRAETVDERSIGKSVASLRRIIEIQRSLIDTLRILETMTSLDFLDFRDLLSPASGFQSVQFRVVENRLGLASDQRLRFDGAKYYSRFQPKDREALIASEEEESLFDAVERWLERTPFLKYERFDFLLAYHHAVDRMLARDEEIIRSNPMLTPEEKEKELDHLEGTRREFAILFDEEAYEAARKEGKKRFSYRAMLAALLINLYRDEPILHEPFRFLESLIDIDENFTEWRHRHAIMVHRMIGAKIGTGGSSGHHYLHKLVEAHKVFTDLFDLSTYLIPRSELPELPPEIVRELGFAYSLRQEGNGHA
ncbi:MAG: tryptophan 2,3-dioxygenase [Euryarchaeota archaeon]|nr:tryptophan 2,3-dioxygenase [Euryarchaeota archaeon]